MQRDTYFLLGKKRPGSGILCLNSRSALSFHARPVIPRTTREKTAVLAFQLDGWVYQPPVGDQTCLGYLGKVRFAFGGDEKRPLMAYGTLGPPPCNPLAP